MSLVLFVVVVVALIVIVVVVGSAVAVAGCRLAKLFGAIPLKRNKPHQNCRQAKRGPAHDHALAGQPEAAREEGKGVGEKSAQRGLCSQAWNENGNCSPKGSNN